MMKSYKVQIAVGADAGLVWSDRGTIRGKSMASMLRRAYFSCFNGNFDAHPQRDNVLYHNKYKDMPVLQLVEIK